MAIHVLTSQASAASPLMAALRDRTFQQDPDRFRANLKRLGTIAAYEISKALPYVDGTVETPLGTANVKRLQRQPVVACLLRAALPFYDGFLEMMPYAESAFLGTYRAGHRDDHSFEIATDYLASDDLTGKDLILTDPMLATGKSLVRNYEAMLKHGTPRSLTIACVVAAQPGIAYVQDALPKADIYTMAIDPALNGHFYIVPGLGDAGDLAFGTKL
jgi:uracil phosphoribosyltransferase